MKISLLNCLALFLTMGVVGCHDREGLSANSPSTSSTDTDNSGVTSSDTQKTAAEDTVSEPVMVGGAFLTCSFADTPSIDSAGSQVGCHYSMNQQNVPLRLGLEIKVYVVKNGNRVLQNDITITDTGTDHFTFPSDQPTSEAFDIVIEVWVADLLLQTRTVTVAAKGATPTPAPPPTPPPATVVEDKTLKKIAPDLPDRDAVKRLLAANGKNVALVTTWNCDAFVGDTWFTNQGPTGLFVDDGAKHKLGQPDNFVWTCATAPQPNSVYRADCPKGARDYFSCKP